MLMHFSHVVDEGACLNWVSENDNSRVLFWVKLKLLHDYVKVSHLCIIESVDEVYLLPPKTRFARASPVKATDA